MKENFTSAKPSGTRIIEEAYQKKGKRNYSYFREEIKKQAALYSPIYRDFIAKIISSDSLSFDHQHDTGFILPKKEASITDKLAKRQDNVITIDYRDAESFPHELGHAVDFWFGQMQALSVHVILSNGKTLKEVFWEEYEARREEIYRSIWDEYKTIVDATLFDGAFDLLSKHMDAYVALCELPIDPSNKEVKEARMILQSGLYFCGFADAYHSFFSKKCPKQMNHRYDVILDVLSSSYDLRGWGLGHHEPDYYKGSDTKPVYEFFANLFEAKVTSGIGQFEGLQRFFPSSFRAFDELFYLFHGRLMKNKRFIDIPLRKDNLHDEF